MSVNMKKSTENKKETSINYENVYLYIQIVISIIFVLSAVILKSNDSNAFYIVKDNYKVFFTTETVYESNFSYNSFLNNISEDLKEKYEALAQTIAYLYGKG